MLKMRRIENLKERASPFEPLPEDFKREWVARLRSGVFDQVCGHLVGGRDNGCRCVLGVAADVCGLDPDRLLNRAYLPVDARVPPMLQGSTWVSNSLMLWNDIDRLSFYELADIIEAAL